MNERAGEQNSPENALQAIRQIFFQECEEQLAVLEAGLVRMKDELHDEETVNAVFRAVHSIKGGASALDLRRLATFAHGFENVLAEARAGRLELGAGTVRLLLRAADALADLIREAIDGAPIADSSIAALQDEVTALLGERASPEEDLALNFAPQAVEMVLFDLEEPKLRSWTLRFRPYADLYTKANDPYLLFRSLSRLGQMEALLDDSALPILDFLDPEEGYLCWTISLQTSHSESEIREVFEFAEGDCDLDICPDSTSAQVAAEPATLEKSGQSELTESRLSDAREDGSRAPAVQTIRVDLERLDALANLVGELVINHALLSRRIAKASAVANSSVALALEDLDRLTRDLQDSVMAVRAQPVKFVFQRMSRVVRDVEAATGKQANLVFEGEDTEIDRTLIEGLADPLTHMIRNAIDHGLEAPADRRALGKPEAGTVRLSARHRAGRVVIEVADDGAGIDRARVQAVAMERGLIAPGAQLSDEELDQVIFMPGFSTARNISGVSGRGVGMDVVKTSVQSLGGRISLVSTPGAGSTITLSLPLTLAVLDGMVISAMGQIFVAPLTAVVEIIPMKAGGLRRIGADVDMLSLRGAHVPALDLATALGLRHESPQTSAKFALLVEDDSGRRVALLADEIYGQRQVVIKSLETNYRHVAGVAAATILGDGHVAFILDVNAIINSNRCEAAPAQRVAMQA